MKRRFRHNMIHGTILVLLAMGGVRATSPPPEAIRAPTPRILASGIAESAVEDRPYLSYVTGCLDILMDYGTDRYGPLHRPLLTAILDVRTLEAPAQPARREYPWRGDWRDGFW
ncbi:hypothetical protein JW905_10820, partial [bacterium]|nr:hypothetical protein [candidate division CSSED10-310 bacterium]